MGKIEALRNEFFGKYLPLFKKFLDIPYLDICDVWVCDYGSVLDLKEEDELEFYDMFTENGGRRFSKYCLEYCLPIFSIDFSFKFEVENNYDEDLHNKVVQYIGEDLYETARYSEFYRHEFRGMKDIIEFLNLLQGMDDFCKKSKEEELIDEIRAKFKMGFDVESNFFIKPLMPYLVDKSNTIGEIGLSGDSDGKMYISIYFGGKYEPSYSYDIPLTELLEEDLEKINKSMIHIDEIVKKQLSSLKYVKSKYQDYLALICLKDDLSK